MIAIILFVFVLGYAAIAFEHWIRVNKAASALLTGVMCWTCYGLGASDNAHVVVELAEHLSSIAGILFFLLGAMTIVELIDAHDGFQIVASAIRSPSRRRLVYVIATISFFLSAVIDNLTTTIVMVSLVRKLLPDRDERLVIVGLVVIAANAGGAWSPIGDVTTTMLWIGGQITTSGVVSQTFFASLACILLPTVIVALRQSGTAPLAPAERFDGSASSARERTIVFWLGIGSLLFVPVFKTLTHLPPYMGMLISLGLLWVVTDLLHSNKSDAEKGLLSVNHALRKIDAPSVLFFLGILLAVSAMEAVGALAAMSAWMDQTIGNIYAIAVALGGLSAVVDNVPLVAAVQGAYGLDRFPTDHAFWSFIAYCAGTGGSALIIGSAAGVAAMGLERIEFFWYVRKVSWLALLGYLSGAAVFLLERAIRAS